MSGDELVEPREERVEVRERRQSTRVDVSLPICIEGQDQQGNHFEERTKSINFSSGGATLYVERQVEVGSKLKLSLSLPHSGELYQTICRVKRVELQSNQQNYRLAVEFETTP